tara:strand:- start:487 stop:870 length:384 start_codon:yes stop_codon:yes gene_type:complete
MKWIQKWISKRKPWIFENSKIPVWLSKISPIEIWALSFACFVFCRGELSKTTLRHETIHYHQQIELLFVGQWLLYGIFWLIGLVKYRSGSTAYRESPFEREAYRNEKKYTYLEKRPLWNWVHYIRSN